MTEAERDLWSKVRCIVKNVHDKAEAKHDTPGEYYMDGGQYAIMKETAEFIRLIDNILEEGK